MGRLIYLLDTNIVSEGSKDIPNNAVLERLLALSKNCAIASVTWYEILMGIEIMPEGKKKQKIEDYVQDTLSGKYPIIPYDEHAASVHSKIAATLRKAGKAKPYADTQIAAIAIANNMILVTHNTADFKGIPLLSVEDWVSA